MYVIKCMRVPLMFTNWKIHTISLLIQTKSWNFLWSHSSPAGFDFPTQEQERRDPQHDENDDQSHDVEVVVGVQHVQLFESARRCLEVTVLDEAIELRPVKSVRGKCRAFETIPNVGEVRYPSQVYRNGIKRDEEPREEKERHRHYWCQEHSVL